MNHPMSRTNPSNAALVCLSLFALFLTGCDRLMGPTNNTQAANSGNAAVPNVKTLIVRPQALHRAIDIPGTVEGYQVADLHARVGGYLEEIFVDIGDSVEKGQVLARLSVPEIQRQLEQKHAMTDEAAAVIAQAAASIRKADADIESAKAAVVEADALRGAKKAMLGARQADFERIRSLVENKAARRELLDASKAQLGAAESEMAASQAHVNTSRALVAAAEAARAKADADHDRAEAGLVRSKADANYVQTMLDYASIRAPFDGQITQRWADPGAYIQPAEGNSNAKPLLRLASIDRVRISIDVPMAELRFLQRGDRVVFDRINVLPGVSVPGNVSRFSAAVNTSSRMMRVEIDLDNKDHQLRPGYYGYVKLYLEEATEVPVVPVSALMTEGDQKFVYVIDYDRARKQLVTTDFSDGTIVGIASGLKGGEQVVRAGVGQIADGQQVTPVPSD